MQNIDLKAQKPAKRYGEAFFEIIKDKDFDKILGEINLFLDKLYSNDEIKNFFFHPIVSIEDKKDVIKTVFIDFSNETVNFIFVLLEENRLNCLDEIRDYLSDKVNSKKRILPIEVTLAIEAKETMKHYIEQKLEEKFNSKVLVNYIKDETIIGGMLIKIKDTMLDLSIKRKLENFKQL